MLFKMNSQKHSSSMESEHIMDAIIPTAKMVCGAKRDMFLEYS